MPVYTKTVRKKFPERKVFLDSKNIVNQLNKRLLDGNYVQIKSQSFLVTKKGLENSNSKEHGISGALTKS
ncbi:hypothetical protein LYNGBM3L_21580 [Moorena producens 3L]|uniref:Uncharacterized protein n=1 Tax=Moorena producens 3L TaxID=489825 RepID=F4XNF9_9CYAN|nr:hypothetical protein LYNGBM3L_21580 [Moorena producens 3L]